MLGKLITKITIFALRSKRLSGEQKSQVTSALLSNLMAIPIRDTIKIDARNNVFVDGTELSPEQSYAFRESAFALKNNPARKLIRDQMKFKAVTFGVHKAETPDMMIFSKAAIWYDQEENALLSTVAPE